MKTEKFIKRKWWKEVPSGKVHQFPDGDLVCGDALTFLSGLKSNCADIVFLDPPFNLGKRYGTNGVKSDRLKEIDYFDFMTEIILQSERILKEGGALYLYHIPKWAIKLSNILQQNLNFRHWIAISMKNGYAMGKKLYPAHYALLYFTKGEPANFKRPKIPPQRCRKCDNYIKDYGGYKKFITDGINLSDIWDDLSPVRHKKYKTRQANELPKEIPRRVIEISGIRKGIFVDPFVGSGISLIAARENGMKFIACDKEPSYFSLISDKLS